MNGGNGDGDLLLGGWLRLGWLHRGCMLQIAALVTALEVERPGRSGSQRAETILSPEEGDGLIGAVRLGTQIF